MLGFLRASCGHWPWWHKGEVPNHMPLDQGGIKKLLFDAHVTTMLEGCPELPRLKDRIRRAVPGWTCPSPTDGFLAAKGQVLAHALEREARSDLWMHGVPELLSLLQIEGWCDGVINTQPDSPWFPFHGQEVRFLCGTDRDGHYATFIKNAQTGELLVPRDPFRKARVFEEVDETGSAA